MNEAPPRKELRKEGQAKNMLGVLLQQNLPLPAPEPGRKLLVDPAGKLGRRRRPFQPMVRPLLDDGVPGRAELEEIGDEGMCCQGLSKDRGSRARAAQQEHRTRNQSTPHVQDVVWKGRYFCHLFST